MFDYFQPYASPAMKAQLGAQFSFAMDLSKRIFDGVQKINELNVQVVKTLLKESAITTQKMFYSINKNVPAPVIDEPAPPPVTEKIRAYQQHLQNILVETQADVAEAIESHMPETVHAAEVVVTEVVQKVSEETMKAAELQKQALEKITLSPQ